MKLVTDGDSAEQTRRQNKPKNGCQSQSNPLDEVDHEIRPEPLALRAGLEYRIAVGVGGESRFHANDWTATLTSSVPNEFGVERHSVKTGKSTPLSSVSGR